MTKDWMNREVIAEECDDTEITVWEVEDPVGDICGYSKITVRSREDLEYVIDGHLDGYDEDDLREGIELKIKLKTMRLGDFKALPE